MKLENRFTVPVPRADAWAVLLDVERIAPCMPGATLTSRDGDEFTGTVKVKVGPINLTYGGQARFVSLDEAAGIAVIEGSGKETRGTGTAKALITCRLVEQGSSTDVQVETDLNVTGKPAQFGRGVLADVSAKLVDRFAASLSEEITQGDGPVAEAAAAAPAAAGADVPTGPVDAVGAPTGTGTPGGADRSSSAAVQSDAGPSSAAAAAGGAQDVPTTAPATPAAAARAGLRQPQPEAEAIDLLDTAGLPVLKRAAPAVVGVVVALLVVRQLVASRRRRRRRLFRRR